MHYILRISLPGFYIARLGKDGVPIEQTPIVVHRDNCILDANELALRRGVGIGMTLVQAKTILIGGRFERWEEDRFQSAALRWLEVCASFSNVIEPEHQHSGWLDLLGHPDPLRTAWQIVEAVEGETGIAPRWALANSKWLSSLLADHNVRLENLPCRLLSPARRESLERLEFLGYRTVGQLQQLTLESLREQFGEEGVMIYQACRGGCIDEVQRLFPPNSASEQLYFAGSVETYELVLGALQYISEHLSDSLTADDMAGSEIRLSVDAEDRTMSFQRRFTKPMQSSGSIFSALKVMTHEELREPIVGIRVVIPGLVRTPRVQRSLMGAKSTERLRGVDLSLRRILDVYGDQAVRLGADVEVPRRAKVLRVWKDVTGWA